MKRLCAIGVLVASCSFLFFNWLQNQKAQEFETIVITAAQEEWLKQRLAFEDYVNSLQKTVNLLEEKYERILNERKKTPHWSAADARQIVQEIEASKKFVESKRCKQPATEYLKNYCTAYEEAKADREWWARLTQVSVRLSAAQYDLMMARIQSGELTNENAEAVKRELMKYAGAA